MSDFKLATPEEVRAARRLYQREGEVEIDDKAFVSRCLSESANGCYVAAWVWVPCDEVKP